MPALPTKLENLIDTYSLEPLSEEGGWFRRRYPQAFTGESGEGARSPCSIIDYAISVKEPCLLHRITPLELYSFLGGNPARLTQLPPGGQPTQKELSAYPQNLQAIPGGTWQGLEASATGPFDYSLVQITVIPEFRYGEREMADRDLLLLLFPDWAEVIMRLTPAK